MPPACSPRVRIAPTLVHHLTTSASSDSSRYTLYRGIWGEFSCLFFLFLFFTADGRSNRPTDETPIITFSPWFPRPWAKPSKGEVFSPSIGGGICMPIVAIGLVSGDLGMSRSVRQGGHQATEGSTIRTSDRHTPHSLIGQ